MGNIEFEYHIQNQTKFDLNINRVLGVNQSEWIKSPSILAGHSCDPYGTIVQKLHGNKAQGYVSFQLATTFQSLFSPEQLTVKDTLTTTLSCQPPWTIQTANGNPYFNVWGWINEGAKTVYLSITDNVEKFNGMIIYVKQLRDRGSYDEALNHIDNSLTQNIPDDIKNKLSNERKPIHIEMGKKYYRDSWNTNDFNTTVAMLDTAAKHMKSGDLDNKDINFSLVDIKDAVTKAMYMGDNNEKEGDVYLGNKNSDAAVGYYLTASDNFREAIEHSAEGMKWDPKFGSVKLLAETSKKRVDGKISNIV